MHKVLLNRLGVLSLPRKSVVRLSDRPNMTLDVYRGRETTNQQQQQYICAKICQDMYLKGLRSYCATRFPLWNLERRIIP